MTDDQFEAIIAAQLSEIDRRIPDVGKAELTHRELDDDKGVMAVLVPTDRRRHRRRILVSARDEDGEIEHTWDEEIAALSFMEYMLGYCCWENPTHGAASPALSAFFARCDEKVPALVHWARWLRMPHESDTDVGYYDPELVGILVEAMIDEKHPREADLMRRAVQGEPVGERDPNQLPLFGEGSPDA
jgi:hypothetical protein